MFTKQLSLTLGRRNLSDLDKAALLERKEPILKIKAKENQRAAGGDRKSENAKSLLDNLPKAIKINVRKDMAQELGVSDKTYGELKTINEKGTDIEESGEGKAGKKERP